MAEMTRDEIAAARYGPGWRLAPDVRVAGQTWDRDAEAWTAAPTQRERRRVLKSLSIDAGMLRRAAEACRNANDGDWFRWVPSHLEHLADQIESVLATEPGDAT